MSLSLRGVKKTVNTKPILNNLDLEIEKGSIFGILGKSGSGKSTLLRCIAGLESIDGGVISVDHVSCAKKILKSQKIGMIFQHFHLLSSKTALDNLYLAMEFSHKSLDSSKALELLHLVGLEDQKQRYPNQLSGGEKQRLAIARALVSSPSILLADEATCSLDPTTTNEICDLLKQVNQELGITIVFVTHEIDTLKKLCEQVAILHEGCVVEKGSLIEVLTRPKHPLTARFLHQNMIHNGLDAQKIYRLSFHGEQVKKPVISYLIKTYGIDISILQGSIDVLSTTTLGNLLISFEGHEASIKEALDYLKQQRVFCEEIS